MGDLYSVRVLELAPRERRVRIDVVVISFDFVYRLPKPIPDPSDPTFFLAALFDAGRARPGTLHAALDEARLMDEAWMLERAGAYIEGVRQLRVHDLRADDAALDAFFDRLEEPGNEPPEEAYPQATFDVLVARAAYLDHLRGGERFRTAAYPMAPR